MSEQQGEFDLSQLKDKIAVVTGAGNNGIGWGLAKHAAALGMHVVIVDLHESLVRTASIKLSETFPNIRCVGIACDVTSPEAMKACLERIDAELPTKLLGAVFANAGVLFNRTILKSTIEQWTTTFNVNVIGVVNTIQAFVPRLQKQGADAIFCTTASIGGLVRGDGGALDANLASFDSVSGVNRDLIVSGVTILHAEIEVLDVEIQVRMNQLLLDELPDDSGHLITI